MLCRRWGHLVEINPQSTITAVWFHTWQIHLDAILAVCIMSEIYREFQKHELLLLFRLRHHLWHQLIPRGYSEDRHAATEDSTLRTESFISWESSQQFTYTRACCILSILLKSWSAHRHRHSSVKTRSRVHVCIQYVWVRQYSVLCACCIHRSMRTCGAALPPNALSATHTLIICILHRRQLTYSEPPTGPSHGLRGFSTASVLNL